MKTEDQNTKAKPSNGLILHHCAIIKAMQHLRRFYKDYFQRWIRIAVCYSENSP